MAHQYSTPTPGAYYPPVPPYEPPRQPHGHHHHEYDRLDTPEAHNGGTGRVAVEVPRLEPQPWVRDLWHWLGENTTGVARVDLRRPVPPSVEQYGNNLLFASYKPTTIGDGGYWRPFSGRGPQAHVPAHLPAPPQPINTNSRHAPTQQYSASPYGSKQQYPNVPQHYPTPQQHQPAAPPGYPQPNYQAAGQYQSSNRDVSYQSEQAVVAPVRMQAPSGARVKITRSFLIGRGEDRDAKPFIDLGAGINIDMDRQKVQPVLRFKIADLISIKAFPHPCVKIAKLLPIARTGMGLKMHYEVPLDSIHHFYRPPARLMVRLDPLPGSGVRLTPAGVELDGQTVKFGKNITLRGSAGVAFPRTLPIDPLADDVGLKVHRLSLKALW